ncbi:MAG TPA: amidase [Polyangiales bacterium]|nr:amidase [Polyangiales bacterium]
MNDYTECDATTLAERVANKDVSPSELVELAIAAIERVNPRLNAIVHPMYESARAEARSEGLGQPRPFRGVPMVVKDFDGYVAGVPFTGSCRFLDGYVPAQDSEAIARLRRAGFVFLAKTNCPELGIMGVTENLWRGATRNPYDLQRTPGGSSGGSAALVCARAVPVAHGGDGGGSLRIPAAQCGLVAIKATRGRVTMGPQQAEGWGGYVQWGALTRSVRDTAALLDCMAGPMPGDPYVAPALPRPLTQELQTRPKALRIGFWAGTLFGRKVHDDHRAAALHVAEQLQALGHHVEEAKPEFDRERLVRAYLTQVAIGVAYELDSFASMTGRPLRAQLFEPVTWFLSQLGRTLRGVELMQAREATQAAGRATGAFHERYDLFMCPTVTYPPVRIAELDLGTIELAGLAALRRLPLTAALRTLMNQLAPELLELTPNTQLFNQTGQPAISLPLALSPSGLPIGIQFAAALGREDLLIQVAAQLEAAHPWADRRPSLSA